MARPYAQYYKHILFCDSETDYKEILDPQAVMQTNYKNKIDFKVTADKIYYHKDTNKYYLTWAYVWYVIHIGQGGLQYLYFRTRQDFIQYLQLLKGNVLIYFHNLSYDFSYLNTDNILSLLGDITVNCAYSSVKPLAITIGSRIQIRDSLRLFNKSIKDLGAELNLPKLDYNYNGERYCNTPLAKKEIDYGFRDVEILKQKYCKTYNIQDTCYKKGYNLSQIPFTSTGAIRKDITSERFINTCLQQFKIHKQECKKINDVLHDINIFNFVYSAYIGGCVYADFTSIGKIVNNIMSIDLTSSYPSSMVFGYYPTSPPEPITANQFKISYNKIINTDINTLVKYSFKCLFNKKISGIYRIKVKNVSLKKWYKGNTYPFITYGLTDKQIKDFVNTLNNIDDINKYINIGKNARYINRKLLSADEIIISLNTIDLWLFTQCYNYDCVEFIQGYEFNVDYDKYFWAIVDKYLVQKTFHKILLKDIDNKNINFCDIGNYKNQFGQEMPENITAINNLKSYDDKYQYLHDTLYTVQDKGGLNGLYGINVMCPLIDTFEVADNGQLDKSGCKLSLKNTTNFLKGMYITSYSRLQLFIGFYACNVLKIKHRYTDTDSLKIDYNPDILDYANNLLYNVCDMGLKSINHFYKDFGLCKFDLDGRYNKFVTNGSKSYIAEHDSNIFVTISGLSNANKIFRLYYKNHGFDDTIKKLYQPNTIFNADVMRYTNQLQHIQTNTGILLLYTDRKINGINDINKYYFGKSKDDINYITYEDLLI